MLRSRYVLVISSLMFVPFLSYASHCPEGAYHGLDNQGNEACRTTVGNHIVDPQTGLMYDSQTGELIGGQIGNLPLWIPYAAIGAMIVFAIILKLAKRKPQSDSYKDVKRMDFTFATKERVKELQKGKCAICDRYPTHWEFDHIATRGDNSIENCQGLCRDCHEKKSLDDNWGNQT